MLFAATQMELEIIILNEVSQTEKDKYQMISLMWHLKNGTDGLICNQKQIHKLRE